MSVDEFRRRVIEAGLLTAEELRGFEASVPEGRRPADGAEYARALVEAGKLTKFQASCVYQGKYRYLVLGQYEILDRLGAGGMGQVFRARHREMDRVVALKILPPERMRSAQLVERFRREVRAAARLIHPNIVTAFDAGEAKGVHFLVMEYVDGRDLSSVVEEHGPLPVEEAVRCVLQAAEGLAYAHEHGVIHRDIKPSNLLLSREGVVKILDMGLARLGEPEKAEGGGDRITGTGQVMGTVDYMAPEQAREARLADHRSDIYSLGCTLYRLLTGRAPYCGESAVEVILAHLQAPIPSLRAVRPEVPLRLELVFQKMVAKRPEDRYQSVREVIEALREVVVLEPVGVRAEGEREGGRILLCRRYFGT
ncbi:MAG: serine/threonine-protein kinase [Thermoguttaceae bacterium]|nr:serine/threonine-protein kinase [Thermoguttaceae bacterium]